MAGSVQNWDMDAEGWARSVWQWAQFAMVMAWLTLLGSMAISLWAFSLAEDRASAAPFAIGAAFSGLVWFALLGTVAANARLKVATWRRQLAEEERARLQAKTAERGAN